MVTLFSNNRPLARRTARRPSGVGAWIAAVLALAGTGCAFRALEKDLSETHTSILRSPEVSQTVNALLDEAVE